MSVTSFRSEVELGELSLPSRRESEVGEVSRDMHLANVATQEPGELPLERAVVWRGAELAVHLAALNGERALGRPVVVVVWLGARHCCACLW